MKEEQLKISSSVKLKINYLFGIRCMRLEGKFFLLHSKVAKKRVPTEAVASVYNSISQFLEKEWNLTGKK